MRGSNRLFILIFAAIIAVCALVIAYGRGLEYERCVAVITQNGVTVQEIDLTAVTEAYTLDIGGANTALIEPGAISMHSADCPDQLCVKRGAISNGIYPIVCLPNKVVIRIESATPPELDAVAGQAR